MTKETAQIEVNFSDNVLFLKGHLTMGSVPCLSKKIASFSDRFAKEVIIDLAQTDGNDTAGLAWLVNMKADLRKKGISLVLENVPQSLRKLSRLSDADKILSIS